MHVGLVGTLMALAVSLATPIAAAAQSNAPIATSASAAIQEGKAEVNGVLYHYLLARGRGEPVVLLHGWGSTSYMWRYVMPRLVDEGYTVLTPDLRGFGDTAKPASGYDKATVAKDIRALVAKLGLEPRVSVIGHDMGGMVTYAYAAQYPNEVSRLAILDVPLPGIPPWDDIVGTKRTWHIAFFGVRDLPEMLITGREREFLTWFHNSWAVNSRAFTNEAEETYARAYSMPGALRAGFEYYRAFPADVIANQDFARHKLTMPVLGIGGSGSFGPIIGDHLREVATDVRAVNIENSGHWVAEEQPDAVADALLAFLPPAPIK
jgi:pimeloyl-ACP methyl ester carboxylesterase